MKLSTSVVTKLHISDLVKHDSINVYLEDFHAGAGRIVIECYGDSWSNYWSHMGEQHTIRTFFLKASDTYLAGKLKGSIESRIYSTEAIRSVAHKALLQARKDRDFTRRQARELWEDIDAELDDGMPLAALPGELLSKLFGDDWYSSLPRMENPDYTYLLTVIRTVKQALSLEQAQLREKSSAVNPSLESQ